MKLRHILLSALLICSLSAAQSYGHLGDTMLMFQFPDHLVPELDGDLSDWDIVPDYYWIRAENMYNQFGAPVDLSDFNCRIAWGYNLSENRAYMAIWGYDDMWHGTEHFSVLVDWDHSAPQYRAFGEGDDYEARWINARAQKYDTAIPGVNPTYGHMQVSGKRWVAEPPWTEWGARFVMGAADTFEPAEAEIEVAFVPFNDVHPDGPEESIQHTFREGDIVGIEVNRGDKDEDPHSYDDAYWSCFGGINAWRDADQFGDYLLAPIEDGLPDAPTAVQTNSWGHIKSSF